MRAFALFHFSLVLLALPLLAAPPKGGGEPVAEGYPAWTGVTPKNYIAGRVLLSGADLRQRVATVVVEFDAAKAKEQLDATGKLAAMAGIQAIVGHGSANWETVQIPRDVMVIYVAHNAKTHDMVTDAIKIKGDETTKFPGIVALTGNKVPIYENVTFEGAPANGGKFPFVYVMGYEGTEAAFKEEFGAKTEAGIKKVIAAQRKKIDEAGLAWRPFYGYVAEPKFFKDIEKTMAKGKPFEPVEAKLRKSVTAKEPEKAKEAQMLCDGLEQTKSDMVFLAQCSLAGSPHVSAYTISRLAKYWPSTKKQISDVAAKVKENAGAQPMVRIYAKIMEWSDPNFTCKNAGEAKKIVAELQKMKKQIQPLTSDKSVTIQNGALTLDGMLDELISVIPTKVPQK